MKRKLIGTMGIVLMLGMLACSDDNKEEPKGPEFGNSGDAELLYVMNQGNYYQGIEGSLNVLDYSDGKMNTDVFTNVNGRSIGATPQCGIRYGSKVYMGICDSNTIEIIEGSTCKSIKQIKLGETGVKGTQPRSMIADGGKIYISMFDGYVARLDTLSMEIEASIQVGPNPETMALYNGKIYVPNSDGFNENGQFGTTATEIDPVSFTVTRTFTVPENPSQFYASSEGLYLLCLGNYYDVAAKLYKVGADYICSEIDDATLACVIDDYIYYVNDPFYGTGEAFYKKYNLKSGEISDWQLDRPEYANSIYYDKAAGRIAISSLKYYGNIWPSYTEPGYVAIYDKNWKHIGDYDCGVGPAAMF